MKKFLFLICLLWSSSIFAQDFSNKGKDFYLAYCYHVAMINTNPAQPLVMTIYMTSDVASRYDIFIGGALTASGNIVAGQVVSYVVPSTSYINDEGLFANKSINVKFSAPSVIYSYITRQAVSGATLVLPVTVLGKEYIASSFTQFSNETNSNSYVTIIAVEDNTNVEITPSGDTKGGWLGGSVNTVTLNKGEVFQILGKSLTGGNNPGVDLSGTRVKAVAGAGGTCKRIAVFSGCGKIAIPAGTPSADNLYQQLYPVTTWGKKYITVPSYNRPNNFYRVYKNSPNPNLKVNGVVVPTASFTAQGYYQFFNNTVNVIEADDPISVAQYFTTQGQFSNGTPYDPDMIMLNPVEQTLANVTLVSSNLVASNPQHHIHCILPSGGTAFSSFKLDGNPVPAGSFVPVPGDPNYSYVYLNNVTLGFHTLSCDSGFNAIAYGYANAESYGYSAGTNIRDIYQFLSIANPNASPLETEPTACVNSPFRFRVTLPYQPTQISWQFSGLFPDVTVNGPIADSVYVIGGKILRRFSLPTPYTIATAGAYPIRVLTDNPTPDGCSGVQQIDFVLNVYDAPIPNFTWMHTGCITDTVFFNENSTTIKPTYKWDWDFADGTIDSVKSPKKKFTIPGTYNVKMKAITTVGCFTPEFAQPITITAVPVANFTSSNTKCPGVPITFNDNSTITVGTITKWDWSFGDATGITTNTTAAPINHTYLNSGTYTVILKVSTASGCSKSDTQLIVVKPKPVASFTLPGGICLPYGLAIFSNNSNIVGGEALTYLWNFGDMVGTSTNNNPNYNYATAGPFSITLIATSASGCIDDSIQTLSTVYPAPLASFTLPVNTCLNALTSFVSSASAGAGSTILEHYWDNGSGVFVLGTATQSFSFATPGPVVIRHFIKTDKGCFSDTANNTLNVYNAPVAIFSAVAPVCIGNTITFNNTSTTPAGTIINSGIFTPGDGGAAINLTSLASFTYTYAVAGSYSATLQVTNDKGCASIVTNLPVLVSPKPVTNFTLPVACLVAGNATALFTNTSTVSDGTALTYLWNFGDAAATIANPNTSTTTNGSHIYTSASSYTISLEATSGIGCKFTSTQPWSTIYTQPQASFTAPVETCLNAPTSFTSTSLAGVGSTVAEHYWDNGSGSFVLGTAVQSFTFSTIGLKNIRHFIKSDKGCNSDTALTPITVLALPIAIFNAVAPVCIGNSITFNNTSTTTAGSNIATGIFTPGDGGAAINVTGLASFTYTYAVAGSYTATLQVTNNKGCVSAVTPLPVLVSPKPVTSFTMPITCLVNGNGNAIFTNTSTVSDGTALTYLWNFGDAAATITNPNTSTTLNGSHVYTTTATPFTISLEATSAIGCTFTTTQAWNTIYAQPLANFTAPAEVCFGLPYNFTDVSTPLSGTITNWLWDFGDGSPTSTLQNPTHNYTIAGPYNVSLIITTSNGCISNPIIKPITVLTLPIPSYTVSLPNCLNQAITFNDNTVVTNAGAITNYAWSMGDGSAIQNYNNSNPFTYTYSPTGNYVTHLIVTTSKGCISDTTFTPITIFPLPIVNPILPEICLLDPFAQFGDTSKIADGTESGFTYLWNFGDATNSTPANPNTSTLKNPIHKYIVTGLYNVSLTVTSVNGCAVKKDTSFYVNGTIPVSAIQILNSGNLCSNRDVQIRNASTVDVGNITKIVIQWDLLGNPALQTLDNNPTPGKIYNHTYPVFAAPLTKTVTIRTVVFSGGICQNTKDEVITLKAAPDAVFDPIPFICKEQNMVNITQGRDINGLTGIGAYFGPGILPNGNFNANTAGIGTHNLIYVYIAANGCLDTAYQIIKVFPTPTVSLGPDVVVLAGGRKLLVATGVSADVVSYLWTPSTYLSATNKDSTTTTPINDITYTLRVTSDSGCTAKDDILVRVLQAPEVPNTFTPNGDGVNDKWEIKFLDTYPNASVEVFNRYGQPVLNVKNYQPWDGKLKGSDLPVGTYYYVVNPRNGRSPQTGYVTIIR